MITLHSRFINHTIDFEFHTGPREPVAIKVTKIGEHQDDPGHKYHKPDQTIQIQTNREELTEMVRQLERLL